MNSEAVLASARYAVDEAAVVVPARVAAMLHQRLGLDALRRTVRGKDRQLDEVLLSWAAIAGQYIERARGSSSDAGNAVTRGSSVGAEAQVRPTRKPADDGRMSAAEAADLVNCTPHAVRLAARQGRLRGERRGDGWLFDPADVLAWRAAA